MVEQTWISLASVHHNQHYFAHIGSQKITWPNFTKILCMSPLAVALSFFDGVVIRYVLPVLWMASYFHTMAYTASCVFLSNTSVPAKTMNRFPTKFCSTIKLSKYTVGCAAGTKSAIYYYLVLVCSATITG